MFAVVISKCAQGISVVFGVHARWTIFNAACLRRAFRYLNCVLLYMIWVDTLILVFLRRYLHLYFGVAPPVKSCLRHHDMRFRGVGNLKTGGAKWGPGGPLFPGAVRF